MIQSLRKKFVFITMTFVTLVLLGILFGIWLFNKSSMEREGYAALDMALNQQGGGPRFEIGGRIPNGFHRDPIFAVTVGANDMVELAPNERIQVSEEKLQEIVSQVIAANRDQGELPADDLRYMMRQEPDGQVHIAFGSISFERQQLQEIVLVTAASVAGAFVLFLLSSVLLARWVLKPVERSWEQQHRFVADASHELKTPLTVILANTGILKNNTNPTGEQLGWLNSTDKEAHRMKGLVDDMLFLAKRDDGSPASVKSMLNISQLVNTSALAFESVAFERGLALEVTVEPNILGLGDEPRLRQLVGILVDNAVKYAEESSTIDVALKKHQNQAVLEVCNQGKIIPPEQQLLLFDRFYRRDSSRSTEGNGLGLSIAKAIAKEHKGKISVRSDDKGTVFTVLLPVGGM